MDTPANPVRPKPSDSWLDALLVSSSDDLFAMRTHHPSIECALAADLGAGA